ncbi:MAG: YidC/Oxa1 family membrane protein insertase, partial [Candidatus Paceibacterota bacterium]
DAGMAVILFTCIVKLILFPLSQKAIKNQLALKDIQPHMDKIKDDHPTDKQAQSLKTLALYKEKGVNPFSSIILLVIQIPIIFALYWVFQAVSTGVQVNDLYSFVHAPDHINTVFLGLFDITKNSPLVLAIIVGLSQFFQAYLTLPKTDKNAPKKEGKPSFQAELGKSMGVQMKYILPIFTFFISRSFSSALSLYWITSNLFAIGQELYVRRTRDVIK